MATFQSDPREGWKKMALAAETKQLGPRSGEREREERNVARYNEKYMGAFNFV
jgi:hypothetical protein